MNEIQLPARFVLSPDQCNVISSWLDLPKVDELAPWHALQFKSMGDIPRGLAALICRQNYNQPGLPTHRRLVVQPLQVLYRGTRPLALNLGFKEAVPGTHPPVYHHWPIQCYGRSWFLPLVLPSAEPDIRQLQTTAKSNRSASAEFWYLSSPHAPECFLDLITGEDEEDASN